MAVRMALAETQIIQQTKQALEEEGVNLDALKYHNATDYKRSNNVILVKNIPFSTVPHDLYELFSPFGTLGRVSSISILYYGNILILFHYRLFYLLQKQLLWLNLLRVMKLRKHSEV